MNKKEIRRKYVEIVATTLHVNNQRHLGVTPPESLTDGWERAYNGTPPSELPKYSVELNFFRNEVDFIVGMLMQVLDSQLRDNHANRSESHQEPVVMVPYLLNRADAVDGHYCIARLNPRGYHEFWNDKQKEWCSAGSVFELGKAP